MTQEDLRTLTLDIKLYHPIYGEVFLKSIHKNYVIAETFISGKKLSILYEQYSNSHLNYEDLYLYPVKIVKDESN